MTLRINLNHIYTPGIPETLIGTLENPKPNPRGFCAKLAHFWAKVQKPSQISILSYLGHLYENLQSKTWDLDLSAKEPYLTLFG